MKIWVEWVRNGYGECHCCPTPNLFTTRENLLEFWRRTCFPADDVDWQAEQQKGNDRLVVGSRVAELVEVDRYFIERANHEKARRIAREQERMREEK